MHSKNAEARGHAALESLEPRLLLSSVLVEGFESGWGGWSADAGVWEVGVPTAGPSGAHAGAKCAGTILAANYPSYTDTRLISPTVALPAVTGNQELWLGFHEWYQYGSGSSGGVQVSEWNGTGWNAWTTITTVAQDGASSRGWSYAAAELTAYAGRTVRLAFYHQADFFTGSGWYVDDVEVLQSAAAWTGVEGFEDGWAGWSSDHGVWQVGVPTAGPSGAHGGAKCAGTILAGNYPSYTDTRLISPTVALPAVTGDQQDWLQFDQWYAYGSGTTGVVQISERTPDGWGPWTSLAQVAQSGAGSPSWSRSAVELTAYAGRTVRLAFYHQADFFTGSGWYVDQIEVLQTVPSWTSTEGFEQGWGGWYSDHGVWEWGFPTAVGPSAPYAGTKCVGTVMNGDYSSYTDSRLISPDVTLPSIADNEEVWLRFYQWYQYGSGSHGTVQVSPWDGGSWGPWETVAAVAQDGAAGRGWSCTGADLTAYAGRKVRICFFHEADFFTGAGWYIDDVAVVKNTPRWSGVETFEKGWAGWTSDDGVWQLGTPSGGPVGAHSGGTCVGTILSGSYDSYTDSRLVSPTVTLPSVAGDEEVWLRFYQWYRYASGSLGTVQVSERTPTGWSGWNTVVTAAQGGAASSVWSYTGADLTRYAGKTVRIAFYHQADFFTGAGWYLDDVEVVHSLPSWTGIEGFENGWGGWCTDQGEWQVGAPLPPPAAAYRGSNCAGTNLAGNYDAYTDSRLISPTVRVPAVGGTEKVELRFYQWYSNGWQETVGTVQVCEWSDAGWGPWTTLLIAVPEGASSQGWAYASADLTAYAGKKVRIAFYHQGGFFTGRGWYVDDAAIVQVRPSIQVQLGLTPIDDGQPSPISFGRVLRDTTPPELTFTISNVGAAHLDIGPVVLDQNQGFELVRQPDTTVMPGASTTLTLRMTAATGGTKSANVLIPSNDRAHSPFRFSVTGTVEDLNLPDLVIGDPQDKVINCWPGDRISVPIQVRNIGNTAASGPLRVALYLSPDETVDAGDTLVGYYDAASLGAGGSLTGTVTFAAPPQGAYYLGAMADALGAVSEFDEANNWGPPITLIAATGPDAYVLSVGVRFTRTTPWACDVGAQRVRDAFAAYRTVKDARTLALNANQDHNTRDLVDAVNAMRGEVKAGDTFVFYINTHGAWADEGDEAPVWVQDDPSNLSRRWLSTGDEYLCLSEKTYDWLSDDAFRQLFADPAWQGVNKLFIMDTCFSGGFWGTTTYGDTGDLATLDRTALIAGSTEGNFSWGSWDAAAKGYIGNLGTALVRALEQLKGQAQVTFHDLFQRVDLCGSIYRGTPGRVLTATDGNDGVSAVSQFSPSRSESPLFQMTLGNAQLADRMHVLTTERGKNAWTFTDADGDLVTVTLGGRAGRAQIVRQVADAAEPGDITRLILDGTDATTTFSITVKGTSGFTTLGNTDISGALKSLTARTTDLLGNITAGGPVREIRLRNVCEAAGQMAGPHTVSVGPLSGVNYGLSLTLGSAADLTVNSQMPVKSIAAASWLDADGQADEITAPWLAALSIAGGFGAGLTLTGDGRPAATKALASATVKGNVAPSVWDIKGPVGSVTLGGAVGLAEEPWQLKNATALGSLTLGDVADAVVTVTGNVGTVKAARWLDGSLSAAKVASITTAGRAPDLSGDFGADVTLTWTGATPALAAMSVAGWLMGATISSAGSVGTVRLGGVQDSTLTAGNLTDARSKITSLTVTGIKGSPAPSFINSNVSAWTLGTVSVKGVQTLNAGHVPAAFGIKGHTINSYARDGRKYPSKGLPGFAVDHADDYTVELV